MEKLAILADAAKYDAACTSSGSNRAGEKGQLGSAKGCGICHAFTPDGRCVSLLKVLMTNVCTYDCQYCINRVSNDPPRATFSPRELADLTIAFYRRNYIEGLFISSAVLVSATHTMERMLKVLTILRDEYGFRGYIHAKCIPGANQAIIDAIAAKADRISVNIELPSQESLARLAPEKSKANILTPMGHIHDNILARREERLVLPHAPHYAPAGQATQMIVGATPDNDRQIIRLSSGLYKRFRLRRVFFSAYIPISTSALLPQNVPPPLLREHRLYQADWLMRLYGFDAEELLEPEAPNFNVHFDPKCDWALRHIEAFPVEITTADREVLLRVPGIGLRSVERILSARRIAKLDFDALKRIGVVLKRAKYFVTCSGKRFDAFPMTPRYISDCMMADARKQNVPRHVGEQLTFLSASMPWDSPALRAGDEQLALPPTPGDVAMSLHGEL